MALERLTHIREWWRDPYRRTNWPELVTAVLTAAIALIGLLQWSVYRQQKAIMESSGKQTENLIQAAKNQSDAASDMADAARDQVDAANNFSDSAEEINRQTAKAVEEFKRLADGTERTIGAIQESSRLDQRAWVGVADPTFTINETIPFKAETQAQNVGKTPAIDVFSIMTGVRKPQDVPFTLADIVYGKSLRRAGNGSLFPGQRFPVKASESAVVPNQTAVVEDLRTGKYVLYVFGVIDYKDVFDRPHWTHFCYVVNTDLTSGHPCSVYNDSDPIALPPRR